MSRTEDREIYSLEFIIENKSVLETTLIIYNVNLFRSSSKYTYNTYLFPNLKCTHHLT